MTKKVWTAVKISLRHKYFLDKKNLSDWLDYVKLLIYFKKDIHNPHYVCPKNLHEVHNQLVQKKQRIIDVQRANRTASEKVKESIPYEKQKGKYFHLSFLGEEGLLIEPMKTVQQVMQESKLLKHCAFTNNYYKKPNSLLFSATVNGKVIETIQVCLRKFEVIQARGMQNMASKYNKQIIDLMRKKMFLIKRVATEKRKKTVKKNESQQEAAA